MSATETTSQSFFEAKYRHSGDPWSFATSAYEQERYKTICNAIGHRRFRRAFEPGCSIGVLTEKLAMLCDRVEAADISPSAVALAKARTQHLSNVEIFCGALPDSIPLGNFDLIVFSEIGYYFTETDLAALAASLVHRLDRDGLFLSVHWLGESSDHLLSGDRVHEVINEIPELKPQRSEIHDGYRLGLWTR